MGVPSLSDSSLLQERQHGVELLVVQAAKQAEQVGTLKDSLADGGRDFLGKDQQLVRVDAWWLREDQRTEDAVKKAKKGQGKEGFKDPFNRMLYGKPPTSNGDFAYIQHIVASAQAKGRCGVVCPQGVLFRDQPEIEEETGELDDDGNPKIRRRKADDEFRIRHGMLGARMIDAVIGLPLNIFYGAGVPACLLILNKQRPAATRCCSSTRRGITGNLRTRTSCAPRT